MDELFRICLKATIPKEFTHENVLEALRIAYQLDLAEEKTSAFHFLWKNLEGLSERKEFKKLLVSHPGLITDFMVKSKGFMVNLQKFSGKQVVRRKIQSSNTG